MSNKDLRSKEFTSFKEINEFFSQLDKSGFVTWFNKNIAGKDYFAKLKITATDNWEKLWSHLPEIYGKSSANLIEFLCVNTIIIEKTSGSFKPVFEKVGTSGHPGISYAFDSIKSKASYNTYTGNKTALSLFSDPKYKEVHGTKPFGKTLSDTTDNRWSGEKFPQGFSGNVSNETSASGILNGFIYESDFMKFRGRGLIQTTGRESYKEIVNFIINYSGDNKTIIDIKNEWLSNSNSPDTICTISTNKQWDELFRSSDYIIPSNAVYLHSKNHNNYNIINSGSSDETLKRDIRNVGLRVSGLSDYADKFYNGVLQQLTLIEGTYPSPTQSATQSATQSGTQSSTQDVGREERTGEKINETTDVAKFPGFHNLFGPTILPPPISFDAPMAVNSKEEIISGLGYTPFIWYNSYQLDVNDIDLFILYNDGIAPCIKLIFFDTLNLIRDKGFPLDDSKIRLFLNPRTPQLKPIYISFKITNFSVSDGKHMLVGTIDANEFYLKKFKSYSSMTSHKALQELCKSIGFGFNTNIDDTSDKMTWINTGMTNYDFMDDIIDSSYQSEQSFLLGYVDFYYNFNYVDLEKELNRNIDKEMGISSFGMEEILKMEDKDKVSALFLTNDVSVNSSNIYFSDYRIINNSTSISLERGYLDKVKYYDELNKSFLSFDIDSITSDGSKTIILKGAPQDNKFFDDNVNYIYKGKIDPDNSHINYNYSYVHNDKNIEDIQKIGIEITMGNPNYNIYRFQKIKILINNVTNTPSATGRNNRLSGDWMITDIKFIFKDGVLNQIINLIKRELELSDEEIASEKFQNSKHHTTTSNGYADNSNDSTEDFGSVTNDPNLTDDDVNWLTTCVIDEAGGEKTDIGKAAVAQVILNRKKIKHKENPVNPKWENLVKGYILARNAFSGFYFDMVNGKYTRVASTFEQAEKRGFEKMKNYQKRRDWNKTKALVESVLNNSFTGDNSFGKIKFNSSVVFYLNPRIISNTPGFAVPSKFIASIGNHNFYKK